jgi:hypothetical protein
MEKGVTMEITDRREFLKKAGVLGLGLLATGGIAGIAASCGKAEQAIQPIATVTAPPVTVTATPAAAAALPWPYKKLDAVAAAEAAYAGYSAGGCMYGAFEGIMSQLRATVGSPYDTIPTAFSKYGGGGISGWGTICGALNGIAAALYFPFAQSVANPIINEVYGWYGVTLLPDYTPAKPKFATCKQSVADSQLCHQSVTKWCLASGFKTTSAERGDRCAWLTAAVVKKTVDLMNLQADGAFKATFAVPASVTGCLSCHGKGGALENVHITNQTDCKECHTPLPSSHPPVK